MCSELKSTQDHGTARSSLWFLSSYEVRDSALGRLPLDTEEGEGVSESERG